MCPTSCNRLYIIWTSDGHHMDIITCIYIHYHATIAYIIKLWRAYIKLISILHSTIRHSSSSLHLFIRHSTIYPADIISIMVIIVACRIMSKTSSSPSWNKHAFHWIWTRASSSYLSIFIIDNWPPRTWSSLSLFIARRLHHHTPIGDASTSTTMVIWLVQDLSFNVNYNDLWFCRIIHTMSPSCNTTISWSPSFFILHFYTSIRLSSRATTWATMYGETAMIFSSVSTLVCMLFDVWVKPRASDF